jgi:hypothetical protein
MGRISFWSMLMLLCLLDRNLNTLRKNTETLSGARKRVDLQVSTEKTRSMPINAGQNRLINAFENVAKFK